MQKVFKPRENIITVSLQKRISNKLNHALHVNMILFAPKLRHRCFLGYMVTTISLVILCIQYIFHVFSVRHFYRILETFYILNIYTIFSWYYVLYIFPYMPIVIIIALFLFIQDDNKRRWLKISCVFFASYYGPSAQLYTFFESSHKVITTQIRIQLLLLNPVSNIVNLSLCDDLLCAFIRCTSFTLVVCVSLH